MQLPAYWLVIGAGIAGLSITYGLAPHGKAGLRERGFQHRHSRAGRSAALFVDGCGTAQARALTRATMAPFRLFKAPH